MLVHSRSTWSFPLPLWVHKRSKFYNYTFLNNSKYIVLFHKFLNAMFFLAGHSDFNLQRTSVCGCVCVCVCGLVAQDLLGDNQCVELPMPPFPWQILPNSSGPNKPLKHTTHGFKTYKIQNYPGKTPQTV